MRKRSLLTLSVLLLPLLAGAQKSGVYQYVDENGTLVITDKPPPESSEFDKEIVNEHGVPVGSIEGKKTAEELEAERVEEEMRAQRELQRRADEALMVTYQNVAEIEMHRDRRVELFQAQSRVTELYLRNQRRQLELMRKQASRYKPYSSDPAAAMVPADLVSAIKETEDTIERHEDNLVKFRSEEQQIIARFQGDINRFKYLKGID